eukprot:14176982-Alexandrium_andersonii.AAC.1
MEGFLRQAGFAPAERGRWQGSGLEVRSQIIPDKIHHSSMRQARGQHQSLLANTEIIEVPLRARIGNGPPDH